MIRFDTARGKLSRKILKLFLASAFLPVVVIGFLSYGHVVKQLRDQSYELSRQASKAIGMELFDRLSLAASRLDRVADLLRTSQHAWGIPLLGNNADMLLGFESVAIVSNTGVIKNLKGDLGYLPALTIRQKNHLAQGSSVVSIQTGEEGAVDILVLNMFDPDNREKGLVAGKIKKTFLWNVRDTLPVSSGLTVLGSSNTVLYHSLPGREDDARFFDIRSLSATSGHFDWSVAGSKYLAGYWSLFTEGRFSIHDWTIVVSQTESDALSAVSGFRSIYVPVLVLMVLIMSLAVTYLIRKKLAPLVELRDATQRIAGGDFNGKVNASSNDELGELGNAFNTMTSKLGGLFSSLSTMAEIDRLILSSFDADYIVSTALARSSDLTPCVVTAILRLDEDHSQSGLISVKSSQAEAPLIEESVRLSADDIHELNKNPHDLFVTCADGCPAYVTAMANQDVRTVLLLPMFIKQKLAAVLMFGYASEFDASKEERVHLREFSDHVAVALSNSGWEERLYHQAHYDALTNLPNRALLKDRLNQAIARAQRNSSCVGVIFLDLDHFKRVNDSLGHSSGDLLLKEMAQLLVNSVRDVDTVVRFGGDEFIVIIPDIEHGKDVITELGVVADKILELTQPGILLENHSVHVDMSVGISIYPKDGKIADELIKNADSAMYHAKDQGRRCYRFYSQELNAKTLRRLELEQELRDAIENDEFELYYQAKVDGELGYLKAAEALIRWNHPERGLVSPFEFIPVLEETGLISKVGDWVIQSACAQTKVWNDAGLPSIRVSVNVSPRQFRDGNLAANVAGILRSTDTDPSRLELEVTEEMIMDDTDRTIGMLKRLHDMGLCISVDDFGTGYSSLSYLRQLPVDILKIDQSFVKTLMEDASAQAITSSIIVLAHKLGLAVTAEGVETEQQWNLLRKWRCDELQGYLFSKPLPAEQFMQLLKQHHKATSLVVGNAQG
ncbi:MAG: EAL domain-containing protein [Pseudomonadota bacterium]